MKNKKNQAETFLIMGLIGLHITLILHAGLLWFTDISFGLSLATFSGMYPSWLTFLVIGVAKIRKRNLASNRNRGGSYGMTEDILVNSAIAMTEYYSSDHDVILNESERSQRHERRE